jgi:hypothetical protein
VSSLVILQTTLSEPLEEDRKDSSIYRQRHKCQRCNPDYQRLIEKIQALTFYVKAVSLCRGKSLNNDQGGAGDRMCMGLVVTIGC